MLGSSAPLFLDGSYQTKVVPPCARTAFQPFLPQQRDFDGAGDYYELNGWGCFWGHLKVASARGTSGFAKLDVSMHAGPSHSARRVTSEKRSFRSIAYSVEEWQRNSSGLLRHPSVGRRAGLTTPLRIGEPIRTPLDMCIPPNDEYLISGVSGVKC